MAEATTAKDPQYVCLQRAIDYLEKAIRRMEDTVQRLRGSERPPAEVEKIPAPPGMLAFEATLQQSPDKIRSFADRLNDQITSLEDIV